MRLALRFMLVLFPIWLAPASAALAQEANQPIYMLRYIEVAPGAENQGISLLKQLADASRKDAGSLRFDNDGRLSRVWATQKHRESPIRELLRRFGW